MDHHDDWGHWPEDEPGFGEHDTADLGGPGYEHLDGYPGHDGTGLDEPGDAPDLGHDGLGPDDLGHDDLGGHGPDLVHESEFDAPADADHDALHDGPDLPPDGHPDDAHPDDVHPDDAHPDDGQHEDGRPPDVGAGHDPGGHDDPTDQPGHDTGHDAGDDPAGHVEADHLVGSDPDAHHDGGPADPDFPPHLDLQRPEPTDGYPWSDPDTLGEHADGGYDPAHADLAAGPPHEDLYDYAGLDHPPPGVDPWSQLLGSDDPATSTLARFWGPTTG